MGHIGWNTNPTTGVLDKKALDELQTLLEAYLRDKTVEGTVAGYGALDAEYSKRYCVQVYLDVLPDTCWYFNESELKLL